MIRTVFSLGFAIAALVILVIVYREPVSSPPPDSAQSRSFAQALLQLAAPEPDGQASKQLAGDEVELCDYGRIKRTAGFDLPATVTADAALAIERAATQLIKSSREAEQSLGRKLRMQSVAVSANRAAQRRWSDCDADCQKWLHEQVASGVVSHAERMVRLALTTRDVDAYANAFQVCSKAAFSSAVPSCKLISAERWAQLDPDNAAPWLYIAHDAQRRKDAQALEQAFHEMSTSKVLDQRWGADMAVMQSLSIQHQP
ncbi:MAG: hypothetical protein ACRECQ_12635, partial [Burkholderiaceae bacterium]